MKKAIVLAALFVCAHMAHAETIVVPPGTKCPPGTVPLVGWRCLKV